MGSSVIAPLIARYQQRFAQVEIELIEQRHGGLIEEGLDLAVRVGALPDSGMVARAVRPYPVALGRDRPKAASRSNK
jgi:DNA-binding transcriptional LysR family regulator